MPNCTATEVPFAKLGRRKIDVRFDGGDVSSDGGLLLLRQVERRLGLLKAVGKNQLAASSPMLCRCENCADRAAAVTMQRIPVEQFIAAFPKAPRAKITETVKHAG